MPDITPQKTHTTTGNRPVMRSINILMTQSIADALNVSDPESRSASVRDVTAVILEAYIRGHEWVVDVINDKIIESSPPKRRQDEKMGICWDKAIVWIPESMYREIERICTPNEIRVSEFLRGVIIYATEDANNAN